jgi:MYXO-CTERM domain-containing protein
MHGEPCEVEDQMKKVLMGTVLSLGLLAGPVASVQAQESDQQAQESESDDDDTGMLGLLGLAGLIGLAGLMRRDRHDDVNRNRDRMGANR